MAPARVMPGGGSSAGKRFIALALGEVGARLFAFGATVHLARTLGADQYGILVAASTVIMYLATVADAGLDMVGVRKVAAAPADLPTWLASTVAARVTIAGVLVTFVAIGATALPRADGITLALYSGTLLATALNTRFVHLGLDQAIYPACSRVAAEALVMALVMTFVRSPADLHRAPVGQLVGEMTGALLLLSFLPRGCRPSVSFPNLRAALDLLRQGWPVVLHGLLGLAIFNSDFLFLRVFQGPATVGYYAASYTLISFVQNLGVAYTMSLIPALSAARADAVAAQSTVDDAMVLAMFAALPVTVGGLIVAPAVVPLVFGHEYTQSVLPLQVLLCVIPVALARNVWQAVLVGRERSDWMLRTVVWATCANLLLNLLLIPRLGMVGAALATVVTEAVRAALAGLFTRRLSIGLPTPGRFAKVVAATAIMALVAMALRHGPIVVTIAAGAASYGGVLVALGGIRLHRNRIPDITL